MDPNKQITVNNLKFSPKCNWPIDPPEIVAFSQETNPWASEGGDKEWEKNYWPIKALFQKKD